MESMKMKSENSYSKFFIMLALSFMAMYVTMYLNTYALDQFYMACLGISVMGVIMLLMMKGMYTDRKKNMAILICSVILFGLALSLVRMQRPIIGDVLYMKGMIPHHSIAILTSERADIKDPEVKKLADGIIAAQKNEIEEMKKMIKRLENE